MLRWLSSRLSDASWADHVVLAAVLVLWFFIMRVGEALLNVGDDPETGDCLRDSNVEFFFQGASLHHRRDRGWVTAASGTSSPRPDQLTLHLLKTKTEQYGGETIRSHGLSGDEDICPVLAAARLVEHREFDGGTGEDGIFFRCESGRPLRREDVERWIKLAARAEGLPDRRANTHSCRMGGASALYAATRSMEIVRRWGRWRGHAADLYVHEGFGNVRFDAGLMLNAGDGFLA